MGEDLAIGIARLEERIVALDEKVDLHQQRDSDQHKLLQNEIQAVHNLLVIALKEQSRKIQKNTDDIGTFKRDRVWIVSVFGLLWGILVTYIQVKLKG